MYLKKLYISGFKSFANPVQLEFDPEVSAIVGPNGSGKSNISDAVRFVLGEQRTRQMRSQKMEDIIFSGTRTEHERGAAEVRLVLDREGDPDLIIARKLFRTGESLYQINGKRVRLKDIHELFSDTGLGKNGYSIVSQGGVDSIVGASPVEIREMVEEAAGIAGFKVKRNETQRRLKDTQENIDRVRDILDEIKRQIGPMKRQADKTRRYLEINEILKVIDLVSFYYKQNENYKALSELNEALNTSKSLIAALDEKAEILDKEYLKDKNGLADLKEKLEKTQLEREEKRKILSQLREERLLKEKTLEYNIYDSKRLQKELERLNSEREKQEKLLVKLEKELVKLTREKQEKEETLKKLKTELTDFEAKLQEETEKNLQLKRREEKARKKQKELSDYIFTLKEKQAKVSISNKNIQQQSEETEKKVQDLEENLKNIRKDIEQKGKEIQKWNEEFLKHKKISERLSLELQRLFKELERFKALRGSTKNKIDYQLELKENYTGYQSSVRSVMKYSKKFKTGEVYGPAAELFKVKEPYTLALQVALGAKAQNIIVKNEQVASELIDYLKHNRLGRATFLPLSSLRYSTISPEEKKRMAQMQGFIGVASDLIDYDQSLKKAFESLLGRVIVLNNFKDASSFRKAFPRYTTVTLSGEIFYPGGAIVGGSTGKEAKTVLFKSVEIDKLKHELRELDKKIKGLEDNNSMLLDRQKREEKDLTQTQNKLNSLKNEKILLKQQEEASSKELESLTKKLNSLNEKFKAKEDQDLLEEIKEVQKKVEEIEISLTNEKSQPVESDLRERIIKQHELIARAEISFNKVAEKKNNKTEQKEAAQKSRDLNLTHSEETETKLLELNKEKDRLNKEIELLDKRVMGTEEAVNTLGEQVETYKTSQNELDKNISVLEERIKELSHQRNLEVENKSKVERKIERIDLNRSNLKDQTFETYGVNFAMVKDEIEDLLSRKKDLSDKEIKELRDERKRIGSVNTEAVEEYTKLKQRYDHINKQYSDLIQAQEDILKTIEDLNKSMSKQFVERFERLNERFSHTFTTLFEGGKARLDYSNPEDILGSGIELSAQPPGKNLKSLNLLSGGEKAMTAIALLFAFIELNPAPFTIIDEIDAALDDSNIYRFTNYIEKMSERNQFIIITHRKSTLRICDKINGVSMAANGVSKLCSLKLSDYQTNED